MPAVAERVASSQEAQFEPRDEAVTPEEKIDIPAGFLTSFSEKILDPTISVPTNTDPNHFQQLLWAKVFEYGLNKQIQYADPVTNEDYVLFDHTLDSFEKESTFGKFAEDDTIRPQIFDNLTPPQSETDRLKSSYPGASPLLIERGIFPLDTRDPKDKKEKGFIPRTWKLGSVPFNGVDHKIIGYVVGIVRTDTSDGEVEAAFYIQGLYDEPMRRFSKERVIGMGGVAETVVRVALTPQEAQEIDFSYIDEPKPKEIILFPSPLSEAA